MHKEIKKIQSEEKKVAVGLKKLKKKDIKMDKKMDKCEGGMKKKK
jgi:hypothetical protein